MASTKPEDVNKSFAARVISGKNLNSLYLLGPTFVLVTFFWVHYQMGLPKIYGQLSFPDIVCLVGCLFLILFFVLSFFWKRESYRTHTLLCGLVCGIISMLCITMPELLPVPRNIAIFIGAALFACYLISFLLLWLNVFEKQSVMLVIIYLLFSAALGYLITWIFLDLDGLRSACALIGIVVLSGLFLLNGLHHSADESILQKDTESSERLPFGFIFLSFAFSISYMYAIMINGLNSFHSSFTWDLPVAALILLFIGLLLRKRMTLVWIFSLAAPLMIVGLLLTLFIDLDSSFLFSFFHLGFFVYLVFLLAMYCGCAQERSVNALRLACLLILGIFVGCILGRFLHPTLGLVFPHYAEQAQSVASILIIGLLVICTVYGSQAIYRLFGSTDKQPRFESLSASDEKRLDADEIASKYGLSEREYEVLQLLLEKKSATQIANELVVAHGTVKAHIRNIYKKLDIHQRDELFALSFGEE